MNVVGPLELVRSRTNRVNQGVSQDDGVAGEEIDELSLEMDDKELLALAKKWESAYNAYSGGITKRQETNKQYYLGRQLAQNGENAPVPDNILFEATETFLAQALARNPDPVVYTDNTDAGNEEARTVRTMLTFLADSLIIRQKMKMMVRHWNIYFLGILKHGYDSHIHEIYSDVRNPKNFILDPAGFVDESGDFIGYLGEKITAPASVLAEMCPKHEQFISEMVEFKMGTPITWTEWWNDDYTFTVFKGNVMDKSMNPHFNYPETTVENKEDEVVEVLREGRNHFAAPKKPYTFLSVYSFQEQPHDETSLLEQNRANQDYITERSRQLAKILKKSANTEIFNLAAGYTQQTAQQALDAIESGTGALEPVENAVRRLDAPSVPDAFFKELEMRTENLRQIYGTLGNTAIKQDEDTTARGMILNQQRSSDRIGGTIGDALNQIASTTFNWWVQLMHVYYTEVHKAAVMGKLTAVEEAVLTAESFTRRLIVMAAPDSTQPKDPITEANQALALYEAELPIDPKTVLTLMDVPDVEKTIEGGILYQTNKIAYIEQNFPELAQMLGIGQPQPGAPPPGQPGQPVVSPMQPPELSAPPNNPSLSQVPLPPIPQ